MTDAATQATQDLNKANAAKNQQFKGSRAPVTNVDGDETAAVEVEARARQQGWVPKEEWRGPADKWVPAAEFVRYGDTNLPVLRSNLKRTQNELAQTRAQLADMAEAVKGMNDFRHKIEKGAYDRAVRDLEAKRAAAITDSKPEEFADADRKLRELKPPEPPKAPAAAAPPQDPVLVEWREQNKWFDENPTLSSVANSVAYELRVNKSPLAGRAFLDEVAKKTREIRPDLFKDDSGETTTTEEVDTRRTNAVESGRGGGPSRRNAKSFGAIPERDQQEFHRFVRMGWFKNTVEDQARYAADYFAGE